MSLTYLWLIELLGYLSKVFLFYPFSCFSYTYIPPSCFCILFFFIKFEMHSPILGFIRLSYFTGLASCNQSSLRPILFDLFPSRGTETGNGSVCFLPSVHVTPERPESAIEVTMEVFLMTVWVDVFSKRMICLVPRCEPLWGAIPSLLQSYMSFISSSSLWSGFVTNVLTLLWCGTGIKRCQNRKFMTAFWAIMAAILNLSS